MGQWVPLELNPQRYVPVPKFHTNDGENCSCSKPPSVEAEAVLHTQCLCEAITDQGPVPWTILLLSAHHQSPPSQSPWKTQCAQRIRIGWMPVHGMAKHRPDVAVRCCAGLGAQPGELGAHRPAGPARHTHSVVTAASRDRGVDAYPPSVRGLLGVKDIAAPEVKFLDRCKINCSEGVLHLPVRRSRMRVWGAKMIRHRRSPPL